MTKHIRRGRTATQAGRQPAPSLLQKAARPYGKAEIADANTKARAFSRTAPVVAGASGSDWLAMANEVIGRWYSGDFQLNHAIALALQEKYEQGAKGAQLGQAEQAPEEPARRRRVR